MLSYDETSSRPCNPRQRDASETAQNGCGRAVVIDIEEQYYRWKDLLRETLIATQGYLAGPDLLEFLDFQQGQLSREHREMIDKEYGRLIELEEGTAQAG